MQVDPYNGHKTVVVVVVKQAVLTCDLPGIFPMNNEYSLTTTVLSFHTSGLNTSIIHMTLTSSFT